VSDAGRKLASPHVIMPVIPLRTATRTRSPADDPEIQAAVTNYMLAPPSLLILAGENFRPLQHQTIPDFRFLASLCWGSDAADIHIAIN
jgi:hypothetical protein